MKISRCLMTGLLRQNALKITEIPPDIISSIPFETGRCTGFPTVEISSSTASPEGEQ